MQLNIANNINKDVDEINLDGNSYTYALNATVEDFDGKNYLLGNTPSNYLISTFKENEKVYGKLHILEKNLFLFFTSDKTNSYIKYIKNVNGLDINSNWEFADCKDCFNATTQTPLEQIQQKDLFKLTTIESSPCFNFNVSQQIVYKLTDCSINIYFADGINEDRYVYLNSETLEVEKEFYQIDGYDENLLPIYNKNIDCDKIKWYGKIKAPKIVTSLENGGKLNSGVYQVLVAYSTSKGQSITSYFNSSFPIPVFTKKVTEEVDYETNLSLRIDVSSLNVNSKYKYLNIVVAHTLRGTTTYKLVQTLPVNKEQLSYVCTSLDKEITLSEQDVFAKNIFYQNSGNIAIANDYLFKADLKEFSRINIQKIANKLSGKLNWFTVCLKEGDYANPEIASKYRSYSRDEVYAMGLRLFFTRGEYSSVGIIPSRKKQPLDIELLDIVNFDRTIDSCKTKYKIEKWELYNTAYITKIYSLIYDKCSPKIYQEGEFSYWESSELYPNIPDVYGELSNTPIRHHKFPDSVITHIHDKKNTFDSENYIFPLGVKLKDNVSIYQILLECLNENIITKEEFDSIEGYEIVRGNRVGNETIVARGLLYDVWNYKKDNQTYFYPNFPLNDLRDDSTLIEYEKGKVAIDNTNVDISLAFNLRFRASNKYTFHSPDTHFSNPTLGNVLKLETEEFGKSRGYFNKCENQAELKLLSKEQYDLAIVLGTILGELVEFKDGATGQAQTIGQNIGSFAGGIAGSAIAPGVGTSIGTAVGGLIGSVAGGLIGGAISKNDDLEQFWRANTIISQVEKILQLFKLLANYENYHWQYQTVGKYTNYNAVLNKGEKIRVIDTGLYLDSDRLSIPLNNKDSITQSNSILFNNWLRESSVFLQVETKLPNPSSVIENSKTTISQIDCDYNENDIIERDIISYYATIKNERINQYGNVFDINWIPTDGITRNTRELFSLFGGDKFIGRFALKRKHSYFTRTLFNLPRDSDIWYSDYPNIAFPKYYFDTTYKGYRHSSLNLGGNPLIDTIVTMLITGVNPREIIETTQQSKSKLKWWLLAIPGANIWAINDYANNRYNFYKYLKYIGGFFRSTLLDPYSFFKVPDYSLDCEIKNFDKNSKLFSTRPLQGKIYLYSYGIPYFICESDYNLDLRYAKNTEEKDFYPRQQDLDWWLQEKNISPRWDNFYYYNNDYSKQNREEVITTYDINYTPKENCKIEHSNRIIYSLQGSDIENNDFKDNYLYNLALDYKDFDYKNGKLTSIKQIENDKILVQFENDSKLFSAYQTLETNLNTIIVGNGGIFRNRPLEFSKPDLGYFGSQHKTSISTEFGHITVDSKRGAVFLLASSGNGLQELSRGKMKSWFRTHLPFTINKYFDINIDNNYEGIGISLGYDRRFNTFYLTKLDYQPVNSEIKYTNNKFYYKGEEISILDTRYFCNKSFTISYNFFKKDWISFHSFTPNYYIDGVNYYFTGLNSIIKNYNSSIWIHNFSNKSYQVYYGKLFPFIVETISKYSAKFEKLNNISFEADKIRVHNEFDKFIDINNSPFNNAIVYNENSNSGILNLIDYNKENILIPEYSLSKTKININSKKGIYFFNQFKNNLSSNTNNIPAFIQGCNGVSSYLNVAAFNVVDNNINKHIEGNQFKVRLINDKESNYKITHKLTILNGGYL